MVSGAVYQTVFLFVFNLVWFSLFAKDMFAQLSPMLLYFIWQFCNHSVSTCESSLENICLGLVLCQVLHEVTLVLDLLM